MNNNFIIESFDGARARANKFCHDREWAKFHLPTSLAIALAGECGEICEIFQWKRFLESKNNLEREIFTDKEMINIGEEIADVFIYTTRLCEVCHIDLAYAVNQLVSDEENGMSAGDSDTKLRTQVGNSWSNLTFHKLSDCTRDMSRTFRSQRQIVLSLQKQVGKLCELFSDRPESFSTAGLPEWPSSDVEQLASLAASICILLSCLAIVSNHGIAECITRKFDKNEAKYPVDLVRGKSSKYTAYAAEVAAREKSQPSIINLINNWLNSVVQRKGLVIALCCMALFTGFLLGRYRFESHNVMRQTAIA